MKQYTKQALAKTLKELMGEKPVDKITVTELVERCGVNRQTFYYHFQDIYGLLAYIYESEAVQAIEEKCSYDTWQQGLREILLYVKENKRLCINTYRSVAREHLESFLNRVLFELLGNVFDEVIKENHDKRNHKDITLSQDSRDFIIKFYCYAFSGTLLEWIATGMNKPLEVLANSIIKIMEGSYLNAIREFETEKNGSTDKRWEA